MADIDADSRKSCKFDRQIPPVEARRLEKNALIRSVQETCQMKYRLTLPLCFVAAVAMFAFMLLGMASTYLWLVDGQWPW